MTAICIAGMHRTGTSMVARLLYLSGLYLGDEADLFGANQYNQEGYWENSHFVFLNNRLLSKLGGNWHTPPQLLPGWENDPDIVALHEEATELVAKFQSHEVWGWKDPRNSFTLPFWKRIVPDLKLVICVRNPFEVVQSLYQRDGFADSKSLALWSASYRSLFLHSHPAQRIVTHYDLYYTSASAELQRLLRFVGIDASSGTIDEAVATISPDLRHSSHSLLDFEQQNEPEAYLKSLYVEESGQNFRDLLESQRSGRAEEIDLQSLLESLDVVLSKAELENSLTTRIERLREAQDKLTAEIARQGEAREKLTVIVERQIKAREKLAARVERQVRAREELSAKVERQRSEIESLSATVRETNQEISRLKEEINRIKESRFWKIARRLPGAGL